MSDAEISSIAIVGGGTAGWMTAAALASKLGPEASRVLVVETPAEGPDSAVLREVEAAPPALRAFLRRLRLDEDELVRRAGASFGLGAEFRDWGGLGGGYFHPWGEIGARFDTVGFQHAWLRVRAHGGAPALDDLALAAVAARLGRFARPTADHRSVYSSFDYGLHLDIARYAALLRDAALARGARATQGTVKDVLLRGEDGFIAAVVLNDGRRIEADLFVDATGLAARLIGSALRTPFEDWSGWLPCDRLIEAAWATTAPPEPYAQARALEAGWRWRVPVQGRTSFGCVYDSERQDEPAAEQALLAASPGAPAASPRLTRFRNGRRARAWVGNCVAIGLSAGVLEPLEAVGLHLVQAGIDALIALFPDRGFAPALAREHNRVTASAYERARDVLALHYAAGQRRERFWRDRREAALPDSLASRLELFASRGRVALYDQEPFGEASWLAVLIGQGVAPARWDPLADALDLPAARRRLHTISAMIRQAADVMPAHADALAQIRGQPPQSAHRT